MGRQVDRAEIRWLGKPFVGCGRLEFLTKDSVQYLPPFLYFSLRCFLPAKQVGTFGHISVVVLLSFPEFLCPCSLFLSSAVFV